MIKNTRTKSGREPPRANARRVPKNEKLHMTFSVSCAAQAVRDTLFCLRAHYTITSSLGFLPAFQSGCGELLVKVHLLFLKGQKLLGNNLLLWVEVPEL